jgi:small subunit ribosomal protein S6
VFPPAQAREADSDRGKRNEGTVNEYEILLMLDPELAEERQAEIVTRTKELVEKGSGSWLSHDVWGRRRLAYEIDHKTDGAYHLLQFDVEPTTLDEIARVLKITDGVMRHMATRRVKGGGTRTAPPPLPPSEAAPQRYEREAPAPAPVPEETVAEETEVEAIEAPVEEPETDVAEPEAEEYAEPTESVESEAPETAPEEEA